MRKCLSSFILLLALLLSACGTARGDSYSLTLWYAEGDPLAQTAEALAAAYNQARGKDTLPVTLRAFADEEHMRSALRSGTQPAVILCSHTLGFTLCEEGLLRDPGLEALPCPDWLRERSDSIGRGFYPLGFELPLLCTRGEAPASLDTLLSAAADFGRKTGLPRLSLDAAAPLFYQVLLDQGQEFTADAERSVLNKNYVNLYNALMEARFTQGLVLGGAIDTDWRIESSAVLRGRDLSGFTLRTLSEAAPLGTAYGLAVTVRDARMQRALPVFLRWLLQPERAGQAALDAGLVPAMERPLPADDPLDAMLLSLMGRELHLPDGDSKYYVNQSAFEITFREAAELLH